MWYLRGGPASFIYALVSRYWLSHFEYYYACFSVLLIKFLYVQILELLYRRCSNKLQICKISSPTYPDHLIYVFPNPGIIVHHNVNGNVPSPIVRANIFVSSKEPHHHRSTQRDECKFVSRQVFIWSILSYLMNCIAHGAICTFV